jgi:hypothetical protein
MVFHHGGQVLDGGIERRPFGNRPGFQGSVNFKSEIVMQAGGVVALDEESARMFVAASRFARSRFGRIPKIPLTGIFLLCL